MRTINNELWIDIESDYEYSADYRLVNEVIEIKLNDTNYLLLNGLTGAIDIVDLSEYDLLFNKKDYTSCQYTFNKLKYRGYFLTAKQYSSNIQKLNDRIEKDIADSNTLVYIVVTNSCTMGCSYCIEGTSPIRDKSQILSIQQVDAILVSLQKFKDENRNLSIMLFGGEPLQKNTRSIIEYLLKKFREANLKAILFSNSLDALSFIEILIEFRDTIISYNTTLDGDEIYHNSLRNNKKSFQFVIKTIDELVKLKIPINIRSNIGNKNLHSIKFLKDFYIKKGWWDNPNMSFDLSPITNHDRNELVNIHISHSELTLYFKELVEEDPTYLNFGHLGVLGHLYYLCRELKLFSTPDKIGYHMSVPRKHGCTIGGDLSFVLTPSGNISNCNEECLSESNIIGSYYPQLNIDYNLSSNWTNRNVFNVNGCAQCKYKFLCGGGCSRKSIIDNHQLDLLECSIKNDFESFFASISKDILKLWDV